MQIPPFPNKKIVVIIFIFAVTIMSSLFIQSCKKTESLPLVSDDEILNKFLNLPVTAFNYNVTLPLHFTTNTGGALPTSIAGLDNTPPNNLSTNEGALLGRVLFYDKNLSKNGTISCGSCHLQAKGFSDSKTLSKGFLDGNTRRHSMTLINSRFYRRGRFFWDERAATLEDQVLMPFQDAVEMGMTLNEVVNTVKGKEIYPILFKRAFGTNEINSDKISKALAQFIRTIVSYSSKYDEGRASAPNMEATFSNFSAEENTGKQLFIRPISNGGFGCFGCHTTEAFVSANIGPQNNGLDLATNIDNGAGETFPNNANFAGSFKTNTLRNIEITAPYMHDGRFTTLEQVIEHYNSGIKAHPNLAPALKNANGTPVRLNMNIAQKNAIVAYLKTLTDNRVATEEKWSNPFK